MLKKRNVCRLIQTLSPTATANTLNMPTISCKSAAQTRSPARLLATFISTTREAMRSKFFDTWLVILRQPVLLYTKISLVEASAFGLGDIRRHFRAQYLSIDLTNLH